MSRPKLKCKECTYGRPKCEKGRKIHAKMTRRYLQNDLQVDEKHKKLWKQWVQHEAEKR